MRPCAGPGRVPDPPRPRQPHRPPGRAQQTKPRLLQLPERLLLPPVAGLRLGRGRARPRAARPHQDPAATQAPPAQAEVQVHLSASRGQGGEDRAVGRAACIVV